MGADEAQSVRTGIAFIETGGGRRPVHVTDATARILVEDVSPYDILSGHPYDGSRDDLLAGVDCLDELNLAPPLLPQNRVLAVAQNYPAHAAEAGGTAITTPVLFLKPPSAFVGHDAVIAIPPITRSLDYEGELAVVIGRVASCVAPHEALRYVAGYTVGNDGSARDLQQTTLADRPMVDWFSAKCLDGCSALGPAIVPAAAVPDPDKLRIRTTLNGQVVQDDMTSSMTIGIEELVAFASARMTLLPGDVLLTGTPAGVGKARGRTLAAGDVVRVHIEQVGELTTRYV